MPSVAGNASGWCFFLKHNRDMKKRQLCRKEEKECIINMLREGWHVSLQSLSEGGKSLKRDIFLIPDRKELWTADDERSGRSLFIPSSPFPFPDRFFCRALQRNRFFMIFRWLRGTKTTEREAFRSRESVLRGGADCGSRHGA